jgi:hypothetical protein
MTTFNLKSTGNKRVDLTKIIYFSLPAYFVHSSVVPSRFDRFEMQQLAFR